MSIFQFTEIFSVMDAWDMGVGLANGSLQSWRRGPPTRALIGVKGFLESNKSKLWFMSFLSIALHILIVHNFSVISMQIKKWQLFLYGWSSPEW